VVYQKRELKDSPLAFSEVILKTPVYDWQAKVLLALERGSKLERIKIPSSLQTGAANRLT
jgi:hypothetical protein